MGYLGRRYTFDGAPPGLEELVASAQKKGALQINFDGDKDRANIAFECHCPGIIRLDRKDDTIFLSGESAHASVLIALLDVCMREASGTTTLQDSTACALPLPLTEAFIAQEVRRMNRIAIAVMLYLSAVVLLVLAGLFGAAWLIIRIVSNSVA
jgi:hypothetical protein